MLFFARRSVAVATIIAGVTGSGATHAAVITYSQPGLSSNNDGNGQDFFLPKFDPALGTLTSVSESIFGQLTPRAFFGLPFGPPLLPQGVLNSFVSIPGLNGHEEDFAELASLSGTIGGEIATGAPEPFGLTVEFQPFQDNFILGSPGSNVDVHATGGIFGLYLGFTPAADVSTFSNSQVSLSYTYTPIPEPGSFALIGAGLFGLCAVGLGRAALRGSPDSLAG